MLNTGVQSSLYSCSKHQQRFIKSVNINIQVYSSYLKSRTSDSRQHIILNDRVMLNSLTHAEQCGSVTSCVQPTRSRYPYQAMHVPTPICSKQTPIALGPVPAAVQGFHFQDPLQNNTFISHAFYFQTTPEVIATFSLHDARIASPMHVPLNGRMH